MKQTFFSSFFKRLNRIIFCSTLATSSLLVAGQNPKKTLAAPTHVQATDGVFTDRIDVSWTKEDGCEYRIYRGTTPSVSDMKEVSQKGHSFGFFSDRTRLEAGKRYFYRVKMRKNGKSSDFSAADAGFTLLVAGSRKTMEISMNKGVPEVNLPLEMTINKLEKDTFEAGENFDMSYTLLNKSKDTVQNTALYFHLSADSILDKSDVLLDIAPLDALSSNRLRRGAISLPIHAKTPKGNYYILIKLEPTMMIVSKKITVK